MGLRSAIKKHDPEKAKQILKNAGINMPITADLTVLNTRNDLVQIGTAIQQQAKLAGFNLNIISADGAGFNELMSTGKIPVRVARWAIIMPEADELGFHKIQYASNYGNV